MIISFVDDGPSYYAGQIESRDRTYRADVPIPDRHSYKPADDEALLFEMVDELQEAFEAAPVKKSTLEELLKRFRRWESSIRQGSMRAL